ncbi:hypothetical protein SAMN05421505_10833 [Sinosporangium album]|uniref:Tetratricopeptide repeat-containing protein n=1 Tax=Sinosporangium album TaxID=504805 RepID=A0A1G7X4G0_9ACTN|nr:hypothetical protein [Sinosporangium album]SDG79045.1 hypothetical protein SAMN05421505_10833 [Sinosporangium album]
MEAARCYRLAGRPAEAESCYLRAGRVGEAAACWEERGDLLRAALVLAVHGEQEHVRQAAVLATAARTRDDNQRLRRDIVLALCGDRLGTGGRRLPALLTDLERDLPDTHGRAVLVEWAVLAADTLGRHDLSAALHAAAHRGGDRGAATRWRAWAERTLGGSAGIPH